MEIVSVLLKPPFWQLLRQTLVSQPLTGALVEKMVWVTLARVSSALTIQTQTHLDAKAWEPPRWTTPPKLIRLQSTQTASQQTEWLTRLRRPSSAHQAYTPITWKSLNTSSQTRMRAPQPRVKCMRIQITITMEVGITVGTWERWIKKTSQMSMPPKVTLRIITMALPKLRLELIRRQWLTITKMRLRHQVPTPCISQLTSSSQIRIS